MQGDDDNDGDYDGADFLQWQRQLGRSTPVAPAADAVPEPAALPMIALVLAVLLAANSRKPGNCRAFSGSFA